MERKKIDVGPEVALVKARKWCAYQERSHFETKMKLREWGLNEEECDHVIAQLIEENFINELRFAQCFARGKFRIKKWGKSRITQELKIRKISAYCLKEALKEIDPEEYWQTLLILTEKYLDQYQAWAPFEKGYKTKAQLMRKGYETDLINDALDEIFKKKLNFRP
jgi:regulatory protein